MTAVKRTISKITNNITIQDMTSQLQIKAISRPNIENMSSKMHFNSHKSKKTKKKSLKFYYFKHKN
jgi:hypothetical protein